MSKIRIEPHYLGSLEYFCALISAEEVEWETQEYFVKQTYRTRCKILTANGVQTLSVPVHYNRSTRFRDVELDYRQSWLKDHKRAIQSAYAKAPYFDYFFDEFVSVWDSKPRFLLDLNFEMMTICLRILQIDRSIKMTDSYDSEVKKGQLDLRNTILAKESYENRKIYEPHEYMQTFGNKFVANLSIIDLLMCEGTGALESLKMSTIGDREQL